MSASLAAMTAEQIKSTRMNDELPKGRKERKEFNRVMRVFNRHDLLMSLRGSRAKRYKG